MNLYHGTTERNFQRAISRAVAVDYNRAKFTCYEAINPTITLINYKFCGNRYRNLTAWLFGYPMVQDASHAALGDFQPREKECASLPDYENILVGPDHFLQHHKRLERGAT